MHEALGLLASWCPTRTNATTTTPRPVAMSRSHKSAAAAAVVLCRHPSCVGTLFHIDFGHVLDDAVTLDTSSFATTPDFKLVLDAAGRWCDFVATCVAAFDALRRHEHLLIETAVTMLSAVQPAERVRDVCRRSLLLECDGTVARAQVEAMVEAGPKALATKLKNTIHAIAVTRVAAKIDTFTQRLPPAAAQGWMAKQGEGAGAGFRRRYFALVPADASECAAVSEKNQTARSRLFSVNLRGGKDKQRRGTSVPAAAERAAAALTVERERAALANGGNIGPDGEPVPMKTKQRSITSPNAVMAGVTFAPDTADHDRSTNNKPNEGKEAASYGLLYYFSSKEQWEQMRQGAGMLCKARDRLGSVLIVCVQRTRAGAGRCLEPALSVCLFPHVSSTGLSDSSHSPAVSNDVCRRAFRA